MPVLWFRMQGHSGVLLSTRLLLLPAQIITMPVAIPNKEIYCDNENPQKMPR